MPALLRSRIRAESHDGLTFDLGRYSAAGVQDAVGQTVFLWMVVGPLTLVAAALPAAAFVEHMGWWLVNDAVLAWRWLSLGVPVWLGLAAAAWALWLSPARQLVTVGTRYLVVERRRLGRVVHRERIAMEAISEAGTHKVAVHPTIIVHHAGGATEIPVVDPRVPAHDLAMLIRRTAATAHPGQHGSDGEVPAGLRALVASRHESSRDASGS